MKKRTQILLEILKKSHKVKFTVHIDIYEYYGIKEELEKLKKCADLDIQIIRVIDNVSIYVELKQ